MATRNLVPRGNNEGSLGIDGQRWSALHVASISTDTLKVTNIQLKANDNLSLFTKGAGIEDISTNGNGQFVIAIDDVFLTSLGFNADGTKPVFTSTGTIAADDSVIAAMNKLDTAVSNVADPTNLDTTNFSAASIQTEAEVAAGGGAAGFADNDTSFLTAAAIKQFVDSQGFGDISGVTAGAGLTGGGNSGAVTLSIPDQSDEANGGFDAGQFGSSSTVPQITVNQKGIVTGITTQNIATLLTIKGDDDVTDTISLLTEPLNIEGGLGITTAVPDGETSGELPKITIALDSNTVSLGGVSVALGGTDATPAFDLQDATGLPTTALTGTITNAQLAGSIANDKLANSSVSFGGVSLSLGGSDATPAFDLQDATGYPASSLTGTITNAQLAGSIANDRLTNSTVSFGGVTLSLGGSDATPAFDLQDATGYPASSIVGSISLSQINSGAIQTEAEVAAGGGAAGFGDNDTSLLTAAAIKQFIDAQNFGTGSGDISRVNITAGTGLSGSVDTATGDHTQTLTLADTAVTAASYGSATQVPTFTVDQQGRLTAAANANIAITSAAVTDFSEAVQDISGAQLVTNGTHAGISAAYDDAGDGAIDLTVSAGTSHIQDAAITAAKLNTDIISGQTELAAGLEATDELLVSDAGTVKRMDTSVLQTYMQNNLTFTTNTDVDVSKANLLTRLASYDSTDIVNIGDADNDTNIIIRGNLTVQGTTTTVDSTTINIQNAFVFEGATDDEFETTLTTIDPTADRTIRLPNQSGFLPVLAVESATQITSTPEELNLLDGSIADTVVNEKAVIYSNAGKIRGDLTGNSDTATALETARSIGLGGDLGGSANFDGTAGITIDATIQAGSVENSMLASDGWTLSLAGVSQEDINLGDTLDFNGTANQVSIAYAAANNDITFSLPATINVDTSGNAATASAWETARTLSLGGDLSGSTSINGSQDVTLTATISAGSVENSMLASDGWTLRLNNAIQEDINLGDTLDFNGTANQVSIAYSADNNDLTFSLPATINVDTSGNSATATSLETSRSISLGGDLGGSANFDGTGDITISATVQSGAIEHGMLNDNIISGQDELAHADIADADDLIIHDSDAALVKKVGVDSLRDHFFGAVSGDIAIADGGSATIQSGAVEHGMLNDNIISGQDELAHDDIADADEMMISDAGTVKRVGVDSLRDHFFGSVSGDATVADGGALTIAAAAIEHGMLNDNIISGQDELVHADIADADDLIIHDTDAAVVKRVGVDSLRDHFFGSVSGDITIADGGTAAIGAQKVTNAMLADDAVGADELAANAVVNASIAANAAIDITKINISGSTQLGGATLAQDDDFVVYDTSTTANKRVTFSNLEDSIFANVSGDATIAAGGALTIAEGAVEYSMIDPNAIKDEDDMASDSASHLATQQSIKKYVDDQLGRFGGVFKTGTVDNGKAASINRDVIFDSSPLVRSHFGPFAFDLGQLATEGGSDLIFFGVTATGASDRHFLVIGSGDNKGDTLFTGANENTP